jgi:hypothetical protein
VTLRRNAARGTWEAHVATETSHQQQQTMGEGAEEGEEDEWVRQRRDSADLAEMVYRIQSFSTSDADGGTLQTSSSAASSLTDSWRGATSIDSNTLLNARSDVPRASLIIGGNRSTVPRGNTEETRKGGGFWSWFS